MNSRDPRTVSAVVNRDRARTRLRAVTVGAGVLGLAAAGGLAVTLPGTTHAATAASSSGQATSGSSSSHTSGGSASSSNSGSSSSSSPSSSSGSASVTSGGS